jgi:type IV pilus assembly protein PilX
VAATATPRFLLENMGEAPSWPGCDREVPPQATCLTQRYRITATSDAVDRAQVVLQSNYAAP